MLYDTHSPKRATNLSINESLLKEARKYKINLSQTLEKTLLSVITQKKREAWLKNNTEALQAYNERIEERGVFSDDLRNF